MLQQNFPFLRAEYQPGSAKKMIYQTLTGTDLNAGVSQA